MKIKCYAQFGADNRTPCCLISVFMLLIVPAVCVIFTLILKIHLGYKCQLNANCMLMWMKSTEFNIGEPFYTKLAKSGYFSILLLLIPDNFACRGRSCCSQSNKPWLLFLQSWFLYITHGWQSIVFCNRQHFTL